MTAGAGLPKSHPFVGPFRHVWAHFSHVIQAIGPTKFVFCALLIMIVLFPECGNS